MRSLEALGYACRWLQRSAKENDADLSLIGRSIGMAIATVLLASAALITTASADVLEDIKARGALIVGVKADYKPFGFRDPSGAIIGLEPDLAADVAGRLGVKLELVPNGVAGAEESAQDRRDEA